MPSSSGGDLADARYDPNRHHGLVEALFRRLVGRNSRELSPKCSPNEWSLHDRGARVQWLRERHLDAHIDRHRRPSCVPTTPRCGPERK